MSNERSGKRFTHSNPTRKERTARAPYNFVPLPEKIITIEEVPLFTRYSGFTGWFDCELVTTSPTYVRGMMTLAEYNRYNPLAEKEVAKDPGGRRQAIKLKEERSKFYSTDLDYPTSSIDGLPVPMIPGSSLRGMVRSIIEVAGFAKMRWVSNAPKVTYRAVAGSRQDPLTEPYRRRIGPFSRNILAGYWQKKGANGWQIQPALLPSSKGWSERAAFLKVKDNKILSGAISGFIQFDDPAYKPNVFEVSFSASNERGKQGPYVRINQIGDEGKGYPHKGVLVCTGNMVESSKVYAGKRQPSPRRNHALVLERDPNAKALPVSEELWEDYRQSLTPFQSEEVWGKGGRADGAPVFFVVEKGAVAWFGHTPNFRIPALNAKGKAATPLDFIPDELRVDALPDLAEAVFGWIEEGDRGSLIKTPAKQHAGRVFFTDAKLAVGQTEVWYRKEPIAPATLAGPKITTFQHYLVQDKTKKHDPDFRQTLAHYEHKGETEIRGHKRYWHKGNIPIALATEAESESQLTRIIPVKDGVQFGFRVWFENLRDFELGSLAWALTLPIGSNGEYRHKLGMGKPLGMGSVRITAKLQLTNRPERYARLFDDGRLVTGAVPDDPRRFIDRFEEFVLLQVAPDKQRLTDLFRIRCLLAMLRARDGSDTWADKTRYLSIRHPQYGNEYKERPVLEDPLSVGGWAATETASEIRLGAVSYIPPGRSYGYIKPSMPKNDAENEGIFFDFKDLESSVFEGDEVDFKLQTGRYGLKATEVRKLK